MAQWQIDPAHTSVEFAVRHMMFTTVRGKFTDVSGTIEFDPENPAAGRAEATLGVASINTGVEDRDNHLRSADFFEVEKYPSITFKSTNIEVLGDNQARVSGDLTIRDVTRPVTLDVSYLGQGKNPYGQTVAGFEASTKINREDFGLTWNVALETGGVLVSKDITISLNVQAAQVAEAETA